MVSDATKKQMLRDIYRIRLFEERLKDLYSYTGFYGDGTMVSEARTVEDMLTCVMYDFEKSGLIGGAVHLYIGEEAVAVGVCTALRDTDWVTSYHRGHGHALAKGLGFDGMMAELLGREGGYSRGCGGSMHLYDAEHGMLGGNGIIGAQLPLALGPAFAARYRGEDGVAVAFMGDGAANQGTFNESMNLAALWKLPVLFVCENNLWAASTPAPIAHSTEDLAPRAEGYGMPWAIVDGQDVMAVHEAAQEAVDRARAGGGPTMIEAKTFRFQGHAGAGQRDHQDPEACEAWMERDPVCLFEAQLIGEGVMSADEQAAMREEISAQVEQSVVRAMASPFAEPEILEASYLPSTHALREQRDEDAITAALTDPANVALVVEIAQEFEGRTSVSLAERIEAGMGGLARAAEKYNPGICDDFTKYARWWIRQQITERMAPGGPSPDASDMKWTWVPEPPEERPEATRELSFPQAVSEGLREEMDRDERVFLIGEDIGGVRERDGMWDAYRDRRVWQTPISESAFTGLATGAAAAGLRPVVEIMYCDFVTVCFDQIVNQAGKLRGMSGFTFDVPMVIKTPAGSGTREGGHHSGSHEAWFMHAPGLKVVMPSDAWDAKGLIKSAIRDDEPVIFIQHRLLHRACAEPMPEGEWLVPIGEAAVKRAGSDITVVAYSYAAQKALRAAEALEGEISVEVVDPRSLVPLDLDTILASVAKTGRLLVVHDAPQRGGAGAEIVRRVTEAGFDLLQAPPRVLAGADVAMPYAPPLEDACIPQPLDIVRLIREMTR